MSDWIHINSRRNERPYNTLNFSNSRFNSQGASTAIQRRLISDEAPRQVQQLFSQGRKFNHAGKFRILFTFKQLKFTYITQ